MSGTKTIVNNNVTHMKLQNKKSVIETEEVDTIEWAKINLDEMNKKLLELIDKCEENEYEIEKLTIMLEKLGSLRKKELHDRDEIINAYILDIRLLKQEVDMYRRDDKNISNTRGELRDMLYNLSQIKKKTETQKKTRKRLEEEADKDLEKYL